MNDFVASRVDWTIATSWLTSGRRRAGSRPISRSTIWAWRTMLVRLWAGPSCIAREMSRRRSSWADWMSRATSGGMATAVAGPPAGAARRGTVGPPATVRRSSRSPARPSRYRRSARCLPLRTSTCESMITARRVSTTSWPFCSASSAGSARIEAWAAAIRSARAARFASCRSLSVWAWATSMSISVSSASSVSMSPSRRSTRSARPPVPAGAGSDRSVDGRRGGVAMTGSCSRIESGMSISPRASGSSPGAWRRPPPGSGRSPTACAGWSSCGS